MKDYLNVGLIGYGYTGQQHARALRSMPDARLIAVAETDDSRQTATGVSRYRDYRDLLADRSIEAVSICLPHFLHEQVSADALNSGKHVLVEKPLAITVEAGERLCRLAQKVSKTLMVEMTHRFLPPLVTARQLIRDGSLGEILAVSENLFENVGLFGSLPRWMLSRSQAGGGVGLTSGIHLVDHVSWIIGQRLFLQAAQLGYTQGLGNVEDTAAFSLRSHEGVPVHITLGWRTGGKNLESLLSLYGTLGTLHVDCWAGWQLEKADGCQKHRCFAEGTPVVERALAGMTSALKEFIGSIRESRPANPSPEESLISQRLIEQALILADER